MASQGDGNMETRAGAKTVGLRKPRKLTVQTKPSVSLQVEAVPPSQAVARGKLQETPSTPTRQRSGADEQPGTPPPAPKPKRYRNPAAAPAMTSGPALSPTAPPASSSPRDDEDDGFHLFPVPRELTPDEIYMASEARRKEKAVKRGELFAAAVRDEPGWLPHDEYEEDALVKQNEQEARDKAIQEMKPHRKIESVPGCDAAPAGGPELTEAQREAARRARPLPRCLACAVSGTHCSAVWRNPKGWGTDDGARCTRCRRAGDPFCILQSDNATAARWADTPWEARALPPEREPRAEGLVVMWPREVGAAGAAEVRLRAEELLRWHRPRCAGGALGGTGTPAPPPPLPAWHATMGGGPAETDWQTHLLRRAEAAYKERADFEALCWRRREERKAKFLAATRESTS